MIDLHTWATPNGYKVSILLEELGVPYQVHGVDIGRGEQFEPAFLAMSPNNRIPAIVDTEGPDGRPYSLFESGAILLYLSEKHGRFWPQSHPQKWDTVQWVMWQMAGVGPMFGQAHHFRNYAPEKLPYAIDRYTNEAGRLYRIMDKRLSGSEWLAGPDYTIADIATWPWTRSITDQGHSFDEYPNVKRWWDAIEARPAARRGIAALQALRREGPMDEKQRDVLFGQLQFARR
jgi:GST-like protein